MKNGSGEIRTFKDLVVWQKAFELAFEIYRVTKSFPSDERYGLTAELRKTARSVPYNIAEGHRRETTTEYIRFLNIGAGSAAELETQLLLAQRLGYFQEETAEQVLFQREEVDRMLNALVRSLKSRRSARS
ncbi:MAG: four helix bundle protein [Acidobacteria bacterium]|nr:MAG: four helix bundle protein [Acidobacteriota bacterium]